MSVYKPAKSPLWAYDFQYKGHRFHGSTGAKTKAKALQVEAAHREQAALSLARKEAPAGREGPRIPTLDEAANEWWESKGKALGRPSDEAVRAVRLETAVSLVGKDKLITDIRTADIADAVRKRRGRLVHGKKVAANATVNRDVIDTIRPVIRRAFRLLDLSLPPIDWGAARLPEPKPKPRNLSADGIDKLLAALPVWYRDFARFGMRYGCRAEEMFFTPDDVDIENQRVRLADRKGGDDHVIPLVGDDAALMAARKGRAQAAGLKTVWFRELKSGKLKPLTRAGAIQAMRVAMRESGLHASQGAKGTHDLRRHAAIEILRATGNLRAAQRLLGHADIKSTLVYADVVEDDIRKGLEAMIAPKPAAQAKNDTAANRMAKA
jgi:integrase